MAGPNQRDFADHAVMAEDIEHPLQAGLEYARIARLYLVFRRRDDLALYLDLLIGRIEEEIETPARLQ